MANRTQNSIRNIIFGVAHRFIALFLPFVSRTIIIYVLGEEYLGLNSLFSSILQVLSISELGFGIAIAASMYAPIARNDTQTVSALLFLYRRVYRIIGVVILVVGLGLMPFLPNLINGIPPQDVNIYVLYCLYIANTVSSYLFFAYKITLLSAHQRSSVTEIIGAIVKLIAALMQIAAILVFKSIVLYVFLNIVCTVSYNLACGYVADRQFPQYRKCSGSLSKELKLDISKKVAALAIQRVGNTVSVSLDAIIISAFLGLTTVAIYGNYNYIVTAIATFVNLIYGSITASIGNSIAVESVEKNYNDFRKFFFLNTWLVGWCCVCFICLFQDFMVLWMGEKLLFGMSIVLCLVMRFYFEQIRKVVLAYKDAAGMWWVDKWRPLAGCIVNLVLNILLVNVIGVAGVMISTVVSYAIVEIPWETRALFKHFFHKSEIGYYKSVLTTTLSVVVAGMATWLVCSWIKLPLILSLLAKGIICVLLPNIMIVALNMGNDDFRSSVGFIKSILQKMKNKDQKRKAYSKGI